MTDYLQPGRFVDSAHPAVIAYAAEHAKGRNPREKAVSLYYAVRDGIRYNPFQNFLLDDTYRGSVCLQRGVGWCVPKAALLAACARAAGIPARVGFADV
ncbi:MAG TPA: transglutaminase family protein, partial [Burkholderiales bacterium]|nr:transglutaminase family protein [Burkholderiales bacterium]